MRRVVVTGMGGVTALGNDWPAIAARLRAGETAIRYMKDWEVFTGVNTRLAAPVLDFDIADRYPRKKLRSMGRVAQLAVGASESALKDANLWEDPILTSGRTGVAYGSSFGSPDSVLGFYELKKEGKSKHLTATNYIRMMGHTTCVNLTVLLGITGRTIPTSCACASGSMAIGDSFEAIQANRADVMIAGGAEELDITDAATFDTLFATSTKNDQPDLTPRPFDADRDGLVVGEGAVTLVLEEYEHAKARGATMYAEVIGFGSTSDGSHITQPRGETMVRAMELALETAGMTPDDIQFVCGHGTATDGGDIVESRATHSVFGSGVPFHSLKGHFGHTLGACGALEAWLVIEMMREGWMCPTANLVNVDPQCAALDYVRGEVRKAPFDMFMSNNFAFGGINTSLVFKAV